MLIHCTSCSCQVKNINFVWQAFYLSNFNFPLPALDFLLQFIQIGFFCDIFHNFWYAKICQLLPQLPVNFLSLCPLLQNVKSPMRKLQNIVSLYINKIFVHELSPFFLMKIFFSKQTSSTTSVSESILESKSFLDPISDFSLSDSFVNVCNFF